MYTVVTYLKNEMNRGDFFMTLRNQPVALSLYRQVEYTLHCVLVFSSAWIGVFHFLVCVFQFCKHQEQDTLKDLFNQDDDHQELGNFYVKASYKEKVGSEETLECLFRDLCVTVMKLNLCLCAQRLEARISLLQSAVDEYNKAKNEFAAKVSSTK